MMRDVLGIVALTAMAVMPLILLYGLTSAMLGGKPGLAQAVVEAAIYIQGAASGYVFGYLRSPYK